MEQQGQPQDPQVAPYYQQRVAQDYPGPQVTAEEPPAEVQDGQKPAGSASSNQGKNATEIVMRVLMGLNGFYLANLLMDLVPEMRVVSAAPDLTGQTHSTINFLNGTLASVHFTYMWVIVAMMGWSLISALAPAPWKASGIFRLSMLAASWFLLAASLVATVGLQVFFLVSPATF